MAGVQLNVADTLNAFMASRTTIQVSFPKHKVSMIGSRLKCKPSGVTFTTAVSGKLTQLLSSVTYNRYSCCAVSAFVKGYCLSASVAEFNIFTGVHNHAWIFVPPPNKTVCAPLAIVMSGPASAAVAVKVGLMVNCTVSLPKPNGLPLSFTFT